MLIRLAVLTATLLATTAAGAIELTDGVPDHPGKTYADLVGQFVEGFALDASGAGTANITTAIRYADEDEAVTEGSEIPGAVKVVALEATTIRNGGEPVLTLKVGLDTDEGGWPIVLLGAFDGDLKLIDDARIDLDSFVSIEEPMAISDKDDGLVVRSSHLNAGENYEAAQLVYLARGELTALPALYGYSVMMCGYQDTQTVGFSAADDGQPGYRPITATLTADHTVDSECDPSTEDGEDSAGDAPEPIAPPWTKSATATYVWSASIGGYIEQANDITALEDELSGNEGEGEDEGDSEGEAD